MLSRYSVSVGLLFVGLFTVHTSSTPLVSPTGGPAFAITAFFGTQVPSDTVVVSVRNQTASTVGDVDVEVWFSPAQEQHFDDRVFAADQSRVYTFRYGRPVVSAYVVIDYLSDGTEQAFSSEVQVPSTDVSSASSVATLGAAVLSLIGVILGAILGHLFTARRDRAQSKFAWRKMLYEHHQAAYTEFLSEWRSSTNVHVLGEQFDRLISRVPVPQQVMLRYRQVRSKLADDKSSAAEKQSASDALYRCISELMVSPWRGRRLRRDR